jgi:anti-sigma factor ChrR (cupin superfamily)
MTTISSNLNLDFSKQAVLKSDELEWLPSPLPGVCRKPLAREGRESGHATSIVRYAPGSSFNPHKHPLGEEILVLEGIFSDENGDYPSGSYIRNPPGSSHAPFSKDGCVLFVKLQQFDPRDTQAIYINTATTEWLPGQGGLQVMPLHQFE